MFQNLLTWAYVFLGIAAFIYWIMALISLFNMLKHRKKDRSLITVAVIGILDDDNFQEEGRIQRTRCFQSTRRFVYCICGMIIVVFIGVQTQ